MYQFPIGAMLESFRLPTPEALATAEKIGTMKLSEKQVPDSCTVFAPSSPATSAPLVIAEKEEQLIPDYAGIIDRIVSSREIIQGI